MARATKYKYEKGDEIGLYRVIKVLPSEPKVKNLVIYSECLLCGEKVKRFSNRMDSKHRGCTAVVKIEKEPEPLPVVQAKNHIRKDGSVVMLDKDGYAIGEIPVDELNVDDSDPEELELGDLSLPAEVLSVLNFDVDVYAIELIKKADALDSGTKFLFITTLRRYLNLVHFSRKIEKKLARTTEMTILGSNGNQVANPLLTQYKTLSSESNVTVRVLNGIISKFNDSGIDDDPLLKALKGGE